MPELRIKSLNEFSNFLKCAASLVSEGGGCEFVYENKTLKSSVANDAATFRAFFTTTCVDSDVDSFSFCLQEVSKLIKAISVLVDIEQVDSTAFTLTDSFISYTGSMNFKIRLVKREVVEKNITVPLKCQLVNLFSFTTNDKLVKKMLHCASISSEAAKIYFNLKDMKSDVVVAEIDDKTMKYTTSIGVPISATGPKGGFTPFITQLELFKMINSFSLVGDITIAYTDKNVLDITHNGDNFNMRIIACILKS
jgi:hypothetical protein